jgi:hypothetical protein
MIEEIIEHSREDVRDSAMSAADRLEARGRAEGEARERALLLRMLEHRFGALPPVLQARVLAAEVVQVEAWVLRLLDAATVDDVFSDP